MARGVEEKEPLLACLRSGSPLSVAVLRRGARPTSGVGEGRCIFDVRWVPHLLSGGRPSGAVLAVVCVPVVVVVVAASLCDSHTRPRTISFLGHPALGSGGGRARLS